MNNEMIRRVRETFLALVKIDNPPLGEREMADYVVRRLASLGVNAEEDDSAKKTGGTAGNLYAFLPGELPLPPLLFCAHLDSVEPARGKKAVVHEDGLITSDKTTVLGADDLAAVAEILEAVRIIREKSLPHRPIELLFTCAEELYDAGSEFFDFSKIMSREAYVPDATGEIGTFVYKAPTIISFDIDVRGRAAHAGFSPEAGINAIQIAMSAATKIETGRVAPDTTVNIGQIYGGTAANIVPDHCAVKGEIRSYSHEKALERLAAIESVFTEAAKASGGGVSFMTRVGVKAYEMCEDAPVIARCRAACEMLGLPYLPQKSFGGSDMNRLAENGISGVVLASAMTDVHTVNESVRPEDMAKATFLILALMTSTL